MPRYAAIDIGSNSVRMEAAEVLPGAPMKVLASDREVTRLGASVFHSGRISEDAMVFVCQVLRRMADAYQRLEVMGVRAVATSAVRDASNQADFIARASEVLKTSVEIISGPEEARLIHLGVRNLWPHPNQRLMIIDVGGGSAEIIISEKGEMKEGLSRPLGAVRLTEVFMKVDPPAETDIQRMLKFIDEKLEVAVKRIGAAKVDRVIATSATAAALVSAINRVQRSEREAADRLRATTPQIRKLFETLAERDLAERKRVPGIGPRRAEIIVAGAAVFLRVLETFRLPSMYYSIAGVRDGIIADLAARGVGRELSRLSRQQLTVVEEMNRKFGLGLKSPRKIASLSHHLFVSLMPVHLLPVEHGKVLEAAAYLHNLGHFISDTGHHKHSAYIVANCDLPGFTDRERQLISLLCRFHRKSMPSARHNEFQSLSVDSKQVVMRLAPLLRLAIGLDTGQQQKVHTIECQPGSTGVSVWVKGEGDIDLELWAAERAAEIFRQIYGIEMNILRVRRTPSEK